VANNSQVINNLFTAWYINIMLTNQKTIGKLLVVCTVCCKDFRTDYQSKRICSFECKQEAARERSRVMMRKNRYGPSSDNHKCIVCGWNLTIDQHHEKMKMRPLCPNHHSLITRNVAKDVEDIIARGL
jgi:hypothetical protein